MLPSEHEIMPLSKRLAHITIWTGRSGGGAAGLPSSDFRRRSEASAAAKALWRDKLAGQVGAASKMPALPEA